MEAHVTSDPGGYSLVVYAGHGCNGSQSHTCIHVQPHTTHTNTHASCNTCLPTFIYTIYTYTPHYTTSQLAFVHATHAHQWYMQTHESTHTTWKYANTATCHHPIPTCINLNVESTYVRENTWCLSLWFSFLNIAISSPTLSWKCHDLTFSYSCIDSILS